MEMEMKMEIEEDCLKDIRKYEKIRLRDVRLLDTDFGLDIYFN